MPSATDTQPSTACKALAQLTDATIARLVGSTVFERGRDYFEGGMVKRLNWKSDGSLSAKVEGTSEPYYDVSINVTSAGKWHTVCSCPYDQGPCKHVAAVMLAAREAVQETGSSQPKPGTEGVELSSEQDIRAYVESAPKEELVRLLLEQAQHDDGLSRRLALKAARLKYRQHQKQKTINLSPYRRQIQDVLSWRGFVERVEVSSLVHELEAVAQAFSDLAHDGYPREAADLLEQFIDSCIKRLEDTDDSDGAFGDFIVSLYADWAKVWATIPDRNRTELAKKILARLEHSDYGLEDHLISAMAEALGEEGLAVIEETIQPHYEARRARLRPKTRDSGFDEELFRWRAALQEVADARNDVDHYIQLCRDGNVTAKDCLEIAKRLKLAGRLEEALAMVERGLKLEPFRGLEELELPQLRIDLLVALGQTEKAQQAAWDEFRRCPHTEALDRWLNLSPKDQHTGLRRKAVEHVLSDGELSEAIEICLRERELPRLAERILKQPKEVRGWDYGTLLPAAKALEPVKPEASILIYRHLAFHILHEKHSQAYHHALDYFRALRRLYAKLGQSAKWQKLAARVKTAHKRKYSFMKPFEQLCTE